ncbi:MAG: tetratricopeptide repeat protein [Magnetococcales bacterium]|nr:tetratricopeptide repeat protein [Magnetococcales bacterium]
MADPYSLYNQGQWQQALLEAQQGLVQGAVDVPLLTLMGMCAYQLGDLSQAVAYWQQVLHWQPEDISALGNLANVLQLTGKFSEAEGYYRRVLQRQPDNAGVLGNYGQLLQKLSRYPEAVSCYEKQLSRHPELADSWNNLGYSLEKMERYQASLAAYQRALTLQPDHEQFLNNYGLALFKVGRLADGLSFLQQAVARHPSSTLLIRAYSLVLLYDPDLTPMERHARRCQVVSGLTKAPPQGWPRKLPSLPRRIAFVSSDFRNHPVAKNLLPLVETLDRQRFELVFYAHDLGRDAMTERLQRLAHGCLWTNPLSDQQVAEHMRNSGVDVVIYLAGHFDYNRVEICRFRPAPLQISLHDGASSGFAEMDFLLSDEILTPQGGCEPFAEKIYRLPVLYQYGHMTDAPPEGEPPVVQNGFITFGSFNNPKKINHQVLDLWSDVLLEVPNSRLRLKYKNNYNDPMLRQRVLGHFIGRGISEERILLGGKDERLDHHLRHYQGVDIALDTFPFNGATTTYEALWMGVPVVTWLGESYVSRMTASLLKQCDLELWIAHSRTGFLSMVKEVAGDIQGLIYWRNLLRQRLATSPLCQCHTYAHTFEQALLDMWQQTTGHG